MEFKIVAREIIKPFFPTPKSYNLSFIDQDAPPIYTKLYFFYQNSFTHDIEEIVAKRSQCLKTSLSKTLTRFYPFAGRIRDKVTVSIEEDDGAEFLEARVDSNLAGYLEKPIHEMFLHFVPNDYWDLGTHPLLIVQASFFKCGGVAIGMNISHKVSDAISFTSFINAWASTAIGKQPDKFGNPEFNGSLIFPSIKDLYLSGEYLRKFVKTNNKTKRFVFTASKIATLQKKAMSETIQRTTRIEAVMTFIWRIGMKMSIKKAGGSPVTSVLLMPVNIRKWLQPPVCEQTFGNLVELQLVSNENCDIELPYLISLFKKEMKQSREAHAKNLDRQQFLERFLRIGKKMQEAAMQPDIINSFTFSSWSKLPFYETDFGWGKPTWVATHNPLPYITYLMDTKDGMGIEAWVNFSEEEMSIFECDEELLTYAIQNPSVL